MKNLSTLLECVLARDFQQEICAMIVRPCSSAHLGPPVHGHMDQRYADTPRGHAVLVLDGGVLIEPSFAALADYRIVEATDEERRQLRQAGYDLDEFRPHEAEI